MPTIDKANGIVIPRRLGAPLAALVAKLKLEFGNGVTNEANDIRELAEALGALPWDAREQDILAIAQQFDPRISTGEFLAAALWPLFSYRGPAAAAGIIYFSYKQVVTSPDPLFAASDLEFFDGAGRRYVGGNDLHPPERLHDTSAQTGTASQAIGSGTTRIAQRVSIEDDEFPQAIRFGPLAIASGSPQATFRIETDSAGAPSGVLANERLEVTGQALVAGANDVIFPLGARPEASGAHWLVAQVSGGVATFDGGIGGQANQVKVWNGSAWANDSNVENLNVVLFSGGIFNAKAAELGSAGNIEAGAIGAVRANGGALTRFETLVGTNYENLEAFEGGRDQETPEQLRARARLARAARGTASANGLVESFTDPDFGVVGALFADILENDTMDWGQQETLINNSAHTGTQSESIDGFTLHRIAQPFTTNGFGSVSAVAIKLAVNDSAELTVRIETDAGGSPSGVLASPKFEKLTVVPIATNRLLFVFGPDFLVEGSYWLTLEPTNGDFRMDGQAATGGGVKVYNGSSWSTSSAVGDINVEVYGGVPPKGFEFFADGGSDDDVAQYLYNRRAPGIYPYGHDSGVAVTAAGAEYVQRFSRPANVDAVFKVEVIYTPEFAGAADDVRDLIAEYVASLRLGAQLVYENAKAVLMPRPVGADSRTIGIHDITVFRQGKKADYATPGALGPGNVVNLDLTTFGSRFRVANRAVDIDVTLTPYSP
jgi:hypothetical protein